MKKFSQRFAATAAAVALVFGVGVSVAPAASAAAPPKACVTIATKYAKATKVSSLYANGHLNACKVSTDTTYGQAIYQHLDQAKALIKQKRPTAARHQLAADWATILASVPAKERNLLLKVLDKRIPKTLTVKSVESHYKLMNNYLAYLKYKKVNLKALKANAKYIDQKVIYTGTPKDNQLVAYYTKKAVNSKKMAKFTVAGAPTLVKLSKTV